MRTLIIYISLSFFLVSGLNAQSVKKGYKHLEKDPPDYAKAWDAFNKILGDNREDVAANFGKAILLADDNSPYFNIVEGWEYVVIMKDRTNELTQDELEVLSEYFMNTEVRRTSRPVKKKIALAVEAFEDRLIKYIREENDLEAVNLLLEKYPDFKHYDNVVHIRNQFVYRTYEKKNTLAAYEEFVEKYPEAAQVGKANKRIYELAFEEIKQQNTLDAYIKYIKEHPESEYIPRAIKLRNAAAYKLAKGQNTIDAYERFITDYPNALEIAGAKQQLHQLLYEKAKRIKSLQAYNDFINQYPDGSYFIDVFNLKAAELGKMHYQEMGFSSDALIWAKAFDNSERIEKAKTINAFDDGSYVITGTSAVNDSAFTDVWVVKVNADGKFEWQKTIGQPYNDVITKVFITSERNILCYGQTHMSADSASVVNWMFLLGPDGEKIWNKNLGDMKVAALGVSPNDKIYFSVYDEDTIPDNFQLNMFNKNGVKVAERDFSGIGTFNGIGFDKDGNVLLAGNKWLINTSPKLYLQWEDTLTYDANIEQLAVGADRYVLGAIDSTLLHFTAFMLNGTKIWDKSFTKNDSIFVLENQTLTSGNDLLIFTNTSSGGGLIKLDALGNVGGEKKLPAGYRFIAATENANKEICYLIEADDLILLKFSSIAF